MFGTRRPAALRARRSRAFQPAGAVACLEPRCLLAASASLAAMEPTAAEQYMLERINQARANPAAEAQRLLRQSRQNPALRLASRTADLAGFARIVAATPPLPPLAFNPSLIAAARDQAQAMLARNAQFHAPEGYLTEPRGQAPPYYAVPEFGWATGENVFAYTRNLPPRSTLRDRIDYLHAGLMLDWGNPDFGHLRNLLAPAPSQASASTGRLPFSEIGIGVLTDAQPTVPPPAQPEQPANLGLNVGPVLVAQEFGWRTGEAFLTGTLSLDRDRNRFYTPGEGLGGVRITADRLDGTGSYTTTTWDSGGYSLPLPQGSYRISATASGHAFPVSTVTIGVDNVGWSVALSPARWPAPRPGRPQIGPPIKIGPR